MSESSLLRKLEVRKANEKRLSKLIVKNGMEMGQLKRENRQIRKELLLSKRDLINCEKNLSKHIKSFVSGKKQGKSPLSKDLEKHLSKFF